MRVEKSTVLATRAPPTSTSGLPRAVQLHKFEAHSAACCGVAWSAVNHHLLVSAAADGSIVFYDTTRLAVVRTLCSDQSFAALDTEQPPRPQPHQSRPQHP